MHTSKRELLLVGLFFTLVTLFYFLPVVTKNTVPIPLNLLVSFYSPWRNEGYKAPNKPIGFDNIRQMLPYQHFTKASLTAGSIPLWDPNIFAGVPHIASLQPAFFYPSTLIDMLFSLENAWTILVVIQPILAGFFTYLFLRALKLSKRASLIGAMSFTFSGWMISWWEEFIIVVHGILWLPLALYGSLLIWQDKKRMGFVWLTIALTLSFFASFTQSTIYLVLTVLTWNIWMWVRFIRTKQPAKTPGSLHPVVILASSGIAMLLLTAIQWVPTIETFLLSPRAVQDAAYIFSEHLLPLTRIVTLFAPDFWGNPGTYNAFGNPGFYHERVIYLGLIPLLFAIIAAFHVKHKDLIFWKFFTLITFSMVFVLPTSWIWYVLRIPLLSAMQPTRIMMVATFGASVLAAYGFEEYLKQKSRRLSTIPSAIIGSIALSGWGWLLWVKAFSRVCPYLPGAPKQVCPDLYTREMSQLLQYGTVTLRNMILPTIGFVVLMGILLLFSKKRTVFFLSVIMLHIAMMGYFAQKYLYFSERSNMYPETPVIREVKKSMGYARVWSYGNGYIDNNILSYFDIPTPEGYAPFFPGKFGELVSAIAKDGKIDTEIDRSDVTLKAAGENEKMTDNRYRLRLMSLLGVRYIIESKNGEHKDQHTPDERFPADLFGLAWENNNWRLWQYKNALPRAFLATHVANAKDTATYERYLFDPDFDLSRTLLLDPSDIEKLPKSIISIEPAITTGQEAGTAAITAYEPNHIAIKTDVTIPSLLFLSDSYYPGWNAYIDGIKTPIYKADYAFRAVYLTRGTHEVTFEYQPQSFKTGGALTILGFITIAGMIIMLTKKNY